MPANVSNKILHLHALPYICGETRAKLLASVEFVVQVARGLHSHLEHAGQTHAITLSTRTRYWTFERPTDLAINIVITTNLQSRIPTYFFLSNDINAPTEAAFSRRPHRQPRQATRWSAAADVEGHP